MVVGPFGVSGLFAKIFVVALSLIEPDDVTILLRKQGGPIVEETLWKLN